ncbi:MAG: hypothetical protein RL087_1771, partial [Pseudomonadota bacterium]
MFDFIRKHTRIALFVLVLLVIPSFVLFGLEGYTRMGDKGQAVAVVDGRDITQIEWDNAHKQEVDRIRAQMPGIDLKLLDSPQARYATLERLVRERVLTVAAEQSRLTATGQHLATRDVAAQAGFEHLGAHALGTEQLLVALQVQRAVGLAQRGDGRVLLQLARQPLVGGGQARLLGGHGQHALAHQPLEGGVAGLGRIQQLEVDARHLCADAV